MCELNGEFEVEDFGVWPERGGVWCCGDRKLNLFEVCDVAGVNYAEAIFV